MKPATFVFSGMNNVSDPADIDCRNPKSSQYGQCVDLVNVDCDNDGGIARRKGLITGLVQHPVTEIMGSRNYWAVGNTVYCSKALSDDEDQRFSTVISLDDMITMIRRVDGGLFVGSTKELHFLAGTDPQAGDGFSDVWTLPYGVIMGTGMHVRGELVPQSQFAGNCCIFASHRGVIVGGPGGQIHNLSQNKVSYEYGLSGKAMIREENGLVHYLFTTSATNPAYNRLDPIVLTLHGISQESLSLYENHI